MIIRLVILLDADVVRFFSAFAACTLASSHTCTMPVSRRLGMQDARESEFRTFSAAKSFARSQRDLVIRPVDLLRWMVQCGGAFPAATPGSDPSGCFPLCEPSAESSSSVMLSGCILTGVAADSKAADDRRNEGVMVSAELLTAAVASLSLLVRPDQFWGSRALP